MEKERENNIIKYKKNKTQDKSDYDEYKNTIFYPSNKEWLTSIYSYNKSYIKSLISLDILVNDLLKSYFNMVGYKIKLLFKRRRTKKIRYSANKIYVSRPELKHNNNKITIMLYVYNKQKLTIEGLLTKLFKHKGIKKGLTAKVDEKVGEKAKNYKNKYLTLLKKVFFFTRNEKMCFFLVIIYLNI